MQKTILAALILCACASSTPNLPRSTALRPGNPVYDGNVSIDPVAQRITADWRIAFMPDSASADSVRLLLNRGLTVSRVTGSGVVGYAVKDTSGFNNITVRFAENVRAGNPVRIDIAYSGVPSFGEDSINGIRRDWIELGLDGFWHPVFAGFDQQITGGFQLHAPLNWQMVASGNITTREGAHTLVNNVSLIDVAFAAAPVIHQKRAANATVYHVGADPAVVERVLNATAACATYLNQRYGAREALPHAKMVIAPRKGPGYARKNYIMLSDPGALPPEALGRFICHELAHFWSSNAVSSGPENWLNEGLAEFVAARFVREAHGNEAYQKIVQQWAEMAKDQPAVWTPSSSNRPGPRVAYRKAPYIMHQLEAKYGVAVMDRILERYMTARIATTPVLLSGVSEVAGAEVSEWLRAELGR